MEVGSGDELVVSSREMSSDCRSGDGITTSSRLTPLLPEVTTFPDPVVSVSSSCSILSFFKVSSGLVHVGILRFAARKVGPVVMSPFGVELRVSSPPKANPLSRGAPASLLSSCSF